MRTLGRNIKEAREKAGIKQKDLATLLGVKDNTIWRWESGERIPRDDKKKKMAEIFGITVAELIRENDAPAGSLLTDATRIRKPIRTNAEIAETSEPTITVPVISPESTACCGYGLSKFDVTSWDGETAIIPLSDAGYTFDEYRPPFIIRVEGDSMSSAGIPSGSRVVINPAEEVSNFDIALIDYFGKLAIKKVRWNKDGTVDLLSDIETIRVSVEDNIPDLFTVRGKAMSVISKLHHGI